MLASDALAALGSLPAEEAIRQPVEAGDTPARRIVALLGGSGKAIEPTTVGDVLFRWARTEPDALAEADVPAAGHVSAILAATGRLPRRLGIAVDLHLAAGAYYPRAYMLSRLVAHMHEAQGCEAAIAYAGDDPPCVMVNGLDFVVQDPATGPPSAIERLTLIPQDILARAVNIANHPLAYALAGITSSTLADILPAFGMAESLLFTGLNISICANAAAQAGRLVMRQDTDALLKLSGVVTTAAAGHIGHVAGQAAAVALFGLAGSWMVVLAPIAGGVAGRVAARNLARGARLLLFCRSEVAALHDAIGRHCAARADCELV